MKNNRRLVRINDEVRNEIAGIIRSDLHDPRISTIASVIKADVTNDLKYCKVYISILGNDEQKREAMEGINSAAGFIRKLLAERINLRQTPELKFIYDDTIEYGMKISKIIDEISPHEQKEE